MEQKINDQRARLNPVFPLASIRLHLIDFSETRCVLRVKPRILGKGETWKICEGILGG